MQSKNAVGNLKNRYLAVLKKCNLLNAFGSLLVVSAITCAASPAFAVNVSTDLELRNAVSASEEDIYVTNEIKFGVVSNNQTYGKATRTFEVKQGTGYNGRFASYLTGNYSVSFLQFEFEDFNTTSDNTINGAVFSVASGQTLTLTDTDFSNNKSGGQGGAIYNAGTVNIYAQNDDVEFTGNTDSSGSNAIYSTNLGALNLNASSDENKIIFNDIVASEGIIHINNNGYAGRVEFNNGLDSAGNVTLHNGTVKFSKTSTLGGFLIINGNVTLQDNTINRLTANTLALNNNLNLSLDVNANNKTTDTLNVGNLTNTQNKQIIIQNIKIIEPTTENSISDSPFIGVDAPDVRRIASYTGGDIVSPLYMYSANYNNTTGNLTLTKKDEANPSVQATAVSASNTSNTQNATNKRAFSRVNRIMTMSSELRAEYMNTLYASNGEVPRLMRKNYNGAWIDGGYTSETIEPDNADKFDYTSYAFTVGYDTSFYKVGPFDAMYGVYLSGSLGESEYTGNDLSQIDASLGGSATFFMNNLYFGATVNVGYGMNELENTDVNNIYYGDAEYDSINGGAALLAGYNIELGSLFMVQPNVMLSYAYVGETEYTSAGNKVEIAAVNALEVAPGLRAAARFDNGFQVYGDAKVAFAFNDEASVSVAGLDAPEVTQGTYSEFGLGVQKDWNEFSLYGEGHAKVGSRQGFGVNAGFKYYF